MEERMKITGNDAKGTPPPPQKKINKNKMDIVMVGEGGGDETEAHASL